MRIDPEMRRCPWCNERLRTHDYFDEHRKRHNKEEEALENARAAAGLLDAMRLPPQGPY